MHPRGNPARVVAAERIGRQEFESDPELGDNPISIEERMLRRLERWDDF